VQSGRSHDLRRAWPKLGEQLRQLREAAGLNGRQLAARLGRGRYQAWVSRVENANKLPDVDDIQAWLEATGATAEQVEQVLELAEQAQHELVRVQKARRVGMVVDLPELQRQTEEAERQAGTIRVFAPILIPALLQTPDYARLLVLAAEPENPTVPEAIARRMQRQARLYEEGRRFEFVISEAALRWRFGSPAVQIGQLRQLLTLSALANVLIAAVPLDRETPVWHSIGFTLLEDRADNADPLVVLEALETWENIADPRLVGRYQQTLDGLRDLAVVGDEARALVERIMGDTERLRGADDE
jgi:transcriptional regulator with XRE-family HTH domain